MQRSEWLSYKNNMELMVFNKLTSCEDTHKIFNAKSDTTSLIYCTIRLGLLDAATSTGYRSLTSL